MTHSLAGIHHITAIASDPAQTVDFYTRILGLRLVKKSVNQDDVATYHLFFGDKTGEPGMDLTFFTFQPSFPGRRGAGQVVTTALTVPANSLPFWQARFNENNVHQEAIQTMWGQDRLVFFDSDKQRLALVSVKDAEQLTTGQVWTTNQIGEDHAIRSFHSAELEVTQLELIEPVLTTVFGYTRVDQKANQYLYQTQSSQRAAFIEVTVKADGCAGLAGAGTVHHIAFRVKDEVHQKKVRTMLVALGLQPTPVIDRYYFKSVYFRVPAGILFELATDGPGFTADEAEAELGNTLALPPFLEPDRQEIEAGLVPLKVMQ